MKDRGKVDFRFFDWYNEIIMNTSTVLRKIKSQQIGKLPVVILPLEHYEKMKEDLEMFYSKKLSEEIRKARGEVRRKKTLNLNEVKKKLKIS